MSLISDRRPGLFELGPRRRTGIAIESEAAAEASAREGERRGGDHAFHAIVNMADNRGRLLVKPLSLQQLYPCAYGGQGVTEIVPNTAMNCSRSSDSLARV